MTGRRWRWLLPHARAGVVLGAGCPREAGLLRLLAGLEKWVTQHSNESMLPVQLLGQCCCTLRVATASYLFRAERGGPLGANGLEACLTRFVQCCTLYYLYQCAREPAGFSAPFIARMTHRCAAPTTPDCSHDLCKITIA